MINAYVSINLPIKDGADVTSEFRGLLKSAMISMSGGAQFKDLMEAEREALSWLYTSSEY